MAENQQAMNGNLADSIEMLEQILEVMPQDEVTLKALYNAYSQSGNSDRAFDHLNTLVDIAVSGGRAESIEFVQGQLDLFAQDHAAEVAAQRARLRALGQSSDSAHTTQTVSTPSGRGSDPGSVECDIAEELALAWRLYEEDQLSQEEYSSVLHDLTEVSAKELNVPVSVLHVLNDRGFSQMNRVMNYLSNRSGAPCLSLSNFEIPEAAADVLPLEIAAHDGALPFSFFGNDLLVGVLNPFNHVLFDKVEKLSGHRCHTYLVAPEEYDQALGRLRGLASGG